MSLPLLRRELVGLLRTRRAFWFLVLTAAASSLLPLLSWPREGGAAVLHEDEVRTVLCFFFSAQLGAGLISVPAFTAGAIAGERERGTLDLLRSALVSPFSIVAAKALAPMGYVVFLPVASIPAACLFYLLGGIGVRPILAGYAITIAAVISAGLVCLAHSMRSRSTAQAAVRGVFWVFFWSLGLFFLLGLVERTLREFGILEEWVGPGPEAISQFSSAVSPFGAIHRKLVWEGYGPWLVGGPPPLPAWAASVLWSAAIGGLHLLYLLYRARDPDRALPAGRGSGWSVAARLKRPRAFSRPLTTRVLVHLGARGVPLLSDPVLQKEIRAEFFGRTAFQRLVFFGTLAVLASFAAFRYSASQFAADAARVSVAVLLLVLPGVVSCAIPREIEAGNLDLLRGTGLPLWRILLGKGLAGLHSVSGAAAAAGLVLLLSQVGEYLYRYPRTQGVLAGTLWTFFAVGGLFVLTGLSTGAVSLLASVVNRRTLGAILTAYLALFVLHAFLTAELRAMHGDPGWLALAQPFEAIERCLRGSLRSAGSFGRARVLGSFAAIHGGGALALGLLAALLLERLRGRDR